jgi:hypothetical protein
MNVSAVRGANNEQIADGHPRSTTSRGFASTNRCPA